MRPIVYFSERGMLKSDMLFIFKTWLGVFYESHDISNLSCVYWHDKQCL